MGWPGPMTHRQFLAWRSWTEAEWNRPDRADFYAMQTAHEARYSMATKKGNFDPKHYTLKFRRADESRPAPVSREEAAAMSKARWGALIEKAERRSR